MKQVKEKDYIATIEYQAYRLKGFTPVRLAENLSHTNKAFGVSDILNNAATKKHYGFLVGSTTIVMVNPYTENTYSVHPKDVEPVNLTLEQALSFNFYGDTEKYFQEKNSVQEKFLKEYNSLPVNDLFLASRDSIMISRIIMDKGYFGVNGVFIKTNKRPYFCKLYDLYAPDSYEDIIMYLPTDWVRYSGYNEEFVKKYLSYLEKCFKETILYEGIVSGIEGFNKGAKDNYNREDYILNDSYYKVRLSNIQVPSVSRMLIMFVSYLYCNEYNNIPGLIWRIKEKLLEVNDLALLIFSHYGRFYTGACGFPNAYTSLGSGEAEQLPFLSLKNFNQSTVLKLLYEFGNLETPKLLKIEDTQIKIIHSLFDSGKFEQAYLEIINLEEQDNQRLQKEPRVYRKKNKVPQANKGQFIPLDTDAIPTPDQIFERKIKTYAPKPSVHLEEAHIPKGEWGQINYSQWTTSSIQYGTSGGEEKKPSIDIYEQMKKNYGHYKKVTEQNKPSFLNRRKKI